MDADRPGSSARGPFKNAAAPSAVLLQQFPPAAQMSALGEFFSEEKITNLRIILRGLNYLRGIL
jgi:hypothetical protein